MKKILIVFLTALTALSVLSLSACGSGTFTVDHIEFMYDYSLSTYSIETVSPDEGGDDQVKWKLDEFVATTHNYYLVGQYNGKEIKIDVDELSDSFKDYTVKDYVCNETDDNGNVTFEVIREEKGAYNICKLNGGMTLTLEDKDGKTHKVVADSGSQFKAVGSGEDTKLLLPEEN